MKITDVDMENQKVSPVHPRPAGGGSRRKDGGSNPLKTDLG